MKRIWSVAVFLALFSAGCGPALISERNIEKHNYIVAQANTLYSLTMPELYEKLMKTNLKRRLVTRTPPYGIVEDWIRRSKSLRRIVKY